MSDAQAPQPRYKSDLIYGLEDRPHFTAAMFAALQHVLASFVGIITPTLIVGGVLGLESEVPYLVSMALFVSGLGTFVQARRWPGGLGLAVPARHQLFFYQCDSQCRIHGQGAGRRH